MMKKSRTPAPKKCIQTSCGNTCIPTTKTCRITEPKAQSNIKRKTSALKRAVDKEVEAAFKTGRAKQAEDVIKSLTKTSGKKRSKSETMQRGLAILEKYGTKSDSRAAVDRMVEAGTKTRRKPMTESEKTAKVLKREQAQRVVDEPRGTFTRTTIKEFLELNGRQEELKKLDRLGSTIKSLQKKVDGGETKYESRLNKTKASYESAMKLVSEDIIKSNFIPAKLRRGKPLVPRQKPAEKQVSTPKEPVKSVRTFTRTTIKEFLELNGRQEELKKLDRLGSTIKSLQKKVDGGETKYESRLNKTKASYESAMKLVSEDIIKSNFIPARLRRGKRV